MMKLKRPFYIFCFMVLMAELAILLHSAVRFLYMRLLFQDFAVYSFGLTWEDWMNISLWGQALFVVVGVAIGYRYGVYWWRKLYIESYHRW